MPLRSQSRILFAAIGAMMASQMFVSPSVAQNFAPVAIVNDQIITGYDVQQRALLNSVTQGKQADGQEALDELIGDTLRLQAAKRFGIDPSPGEIRDGFSEISRRNRRDPNQMRAGLLSRGISTEALDAQIKAEVAWRRLVVQRFGGRVRVSDSDVDAMVGPEADETPGETQYFLTEMRFPIQQGGEAAAKAAADKAIVQMTSGA